MLKNELLEIAQVVENFEKPSLDQDSFKALVNCLGNSISAICCNIRGSWEAAAFSDTSHDSLVRYFHYHLEGIRHLSDTLFANYHKMPENTPDEINRALNALIDFQEEYFRGYFNKDAIAPQAYTIKTLSALSESIDSLRETLAVSNINRDLKNCVTDYLHQISLKEHKAYYTFRSLFYFRDFVLGAKRLAPAAGSALSEDLLVQMLKKINFNHLAFFNYLRYQYTAASNDLLPKEKLQQLYMVFNTLKWQPNSETSYDNSWPSINTMLRGWLTEEISFIEKDTKENHELSQPLNEKLSLNLSVAHLACLTRLFFEENVFNSARLTGIFKFITCHYSTKRQANISIGSLSKEYYSTGQVTAAVVRDILLRMVARINHNFFPVLVAISAVTHTWIKIL